MRVDFRKNPKAFVVINPVSGTLQPDMKRETIRSALQARNVPYEVYETTGKEQIPEVVREAVKIGFELFLVAGGDGTVSAVGSGLVGANLPLVVIPTGTWNALARNLDIPLQIEQALELLFGEHEIRTIDVMQVGDNFHLLNISSGVGARAMRNVEREHKRRFWVFADLWVALSQLMGFQTHRFEVRIDGQVTTFRALEVMVANSRIIGIKSMRLDPGIRMDDGKLNVCRINANNLIDLLDLAISMLQGKQRENLHVMCLDAFQEVEIRARRKLPVQADGDLIGYLPISVKVRPKALQIVTPPGVAEV